MSLPEQNPELQIPHSFLLPPTVSDTENDGLNYNDLTSSPIISVAPWLGINSESKLWLHCECTYADGRDGIIELAEAVSVGTSTGEQVFSCELPLDKLSKLADNTTITIILMVSSDGTLAKQSLNSVRYSLIFKHPITMTNYSRWMTDIGSNMEQLKIHDLILPEAHNAGVDQEGAGWPADQWAACQDDSFSYQLRNGVRALDLRLYRRSKETGTHQEFIFEHGGYDADRNLDHCIHGVLEFTEQNPGEIVILDFHETVIDGRESHVAGIIDIVLGNRCIPATAKDLTIGQIRSRFPGRNIIIAWNHSHWHCWPKVEQTWTGEDLNGERDLYDHIIRTMAAPPTNKLWSIFAAGYDLLGPIRFGPRAIHWDAFFNRVGSDRYRQPSKGNMINVDFFAETGVVDRCINATRIRANQASLSRPVGLTTSNITTNSIHLKWEPPLDNETVNHYAFFVNDELVGWQNSMEHTFDGLKDGVTYRLQVLAVFNSGQGAAAEIVARTVEIPDTIKPTPPTDLNFVFSGDENFARLQWTASADNVAVIGYQVYRNGLPFGGVVQQTFILIDAVVNTSYKVRALDAAGNFADSASLTVPADKIPPSKPTNLRASTITISSVSLEWGASADNVAVTGYRIYRNDTPVDTVSGTFYIDRNLTEGTHYVYKVRALDAAGNFADSDPLPVTTVDETAPSKPINLKIVTITDKSALLWDKSTDNVKVIGYEVYRNETLLGKIGDTAFVPVDVTQPYSFKVRALDAAGNYADSDLLVSKDNQPPSKPTNLRPTTITGISATLEWAASSDNVAVTGYQIFRDNTLITTVGSTRYTATGLSNSTTYRFEVRALDAAGNGSEPAGVEVETAASNAPTNLEFYRSADSTGTLTWEPPIESGGVTGYQLSRDGRILGELSDTYFLFFNLTPGTTHLFEVRAIRNGQYSDPASIRG